MRESKGQAGFIALMSAIIISVVLLLLVTTGSLAGFFGRFNALDSELKERSFAAADACVDIALLAVANDPTYAGNATSTLSATDSCYVGPVTSAGGQKSFETRSYFNNSYTNLAVSIDANTLTVNSWQEVANF